MGRVPFTITFSPFLNSKYNMIILAFGCLTLKMAIANTTTASRSNRNFPATFLRLWAPTPRLPPPGSIRVFILYQNADEWIDLFAGKSRRFIYRKIGRIPAVHANGKHQRNEQGRGLAARACTAISRTPRVIANCYRCCAPLTRVNHVHAIRSL